MRAIAWLPRKTVEAAWVAFALANLVAQNDGRSVRTGLIARAIAGAVVDDDGFEPAVPRHLVENAADLPCLVEGGNDHCHERRADGIGLREGHLPPRLATASGAQDARVAGPRATDRKY